ncbi:MAG TPA: hypothetical protein VJZ52_00185 [Candidatus Paceibacterota bacterium]|nr:hypothetical protein [Candidatus Paceibacterota bacterium]
MSMNSHRLKKLVLALKESEIYGNIVSLIVFGSQAYQADDGVNDEDFCLVLRERKQNDLTVIAEVFRKEFKNLDITVYYERELDGTLPFRDIGTGCFALHYFALGEAVIGKNIFIKKHQELPRKLYRQSLKEKMFDYLLRLRRAYIIYESKKKLVAYFRKYTARLLIDLMIYKNPSVLGSVIRRSPEETLLEAKKLKIITEVPSQSGSRVVSEYLRILGEITNKLLELVGN